MRRCGERVEAAKELNECQHRRREVDVPLAQSGVYLTVAWLSSTIPDVDALPDELDIVV
jgi:hypothetical protein